MGWICFMKHSSFVVGSFICVHFLFFYLYFFFVNLGFLYQTFKEIFGSDVWLYKKHGKLSLQLICKTKIFLTKSFKIDSKAILSILKSF